MEKLALWSSRMAGAREMLRYLYERGELNLMKEVPTKMGRKVYEKAIYDWLISDLDHIFSFLSGEDIRFLNHQKDSKGKLIKVEVLGEREYARKISVRQEDGDIRSF